MYRKLTLTYENEELHLVWIKTRVTHIEGGFDFLGFSLRQYNTGQGKKLFIKPSRDSIKKARNKIKDTFSVMRGRPVKELIRVLNPIIRGYGQYWKHVVSKKTYNHMDNYVFLKVRNILNNCIQRSRENGLANVILRSPTTVEIINGFSHVHLLTFNC
ncbi:group II intron maturase-specific domain-containing protein [Priestia aryabhattai]